MMTRRTFAFASLLAAGVSASNASAEGAVEAALGGPLVTCTGAIAWTENGRDERMRVEPMRIAVPDVVEANAIALFLTEDDFLPDDVWKCEAGLCISAGSSAAGVTTNAIRLQHVVDLGNGETVYRLEALFMAIGAGADGLQVDGASGSGAFICDDKLPEAIVISGE